jgi:hypothetical protein
LLDPSERELVEEVIWVFPWVIMRVEEEEIKRVWVVGISVEQIEAEVSQRDGKRMVRMPGGEYHHESE